MLRDYIGASRAKRARHRRRPGRSPNAADDDGRWARIFDRDPAVASPPRASGRRCRCSARERARASRGGSGGGQALMPFSMGERATWGRTAIPVMARPNDQRVDVVSALVSVDRLQVQHVADHLVLLGDAVAAVHVARPAGDLGALPALLRLTRLIISGAKRPLVHQAADAQGWPAGRARSRSSCRRASSGRVGWRRAACRTVCAPGRRSARRRGRIRPRPCEPHEMP